MFGIFYGTHLELQVRVIAVIVIYFIDNQSNKTKQ
jgi:hypothetical protein